MTQSEDVHTRGDTLSAQLTLAAQSHYRWLAGLTVVLLVLLVSLAAWGPEMTFPVTVSSREVPTEGGGSLVLDRTVREVTGGAIDDAVTWVTREGSWVFDSLSTVVTYALVYIEDVLKWTPWPTIVVGLVLLSFAVRGLSLVIFTLLALLFIGFMGLWPNTIDTIALMVVAVLIAVSIGLPLGVRCGEQPAGRQPDAARPGRYADNAQLRVPASGHPVFRPGQARRQYSQRSSTRCRR